MKISRQRIPKPFRTPRPMASAPARRRPGWLEIDALAVAAGMVIATVAPLGGADDAARSLSLAAVADRAPSAHALLVTIAPEDLRGGGCARALSDVLGRAGARGALVLAPADAFCAAEGSGMMIVGLPLHHLRVRGGSVVGFEGGAEASLGALGVAASPWVAPKAPRSVPIVELGDLERGALPLSVLEGRVALVAIGGGDAASHGRAPAALPPAEGAAEALGGLLDGRRRAEAPAWAAPLFVLVAGVLLRLASRRGQLATAGAMAALAAALVGLQALLAAVLEASLLPMASALFGLAAAFAGVAGARARRAAAAAGSAGDLLERAALHRLQGIDALPPAEFWLRVARLAAQAHPADAVLVADLPPGEWHLRFWNDRQGGEQLVAERRRDVRRMPYSNEQGVPKIQVIQRFLTREEMPVVAVPLLAAGELEGYAFLCGASAEAAFAKDPERAERVGRELGLLARRRRLARGADAAESAPDAGSDLVESAQAALGDLRLLGAALRGAPAAMAIADAFGDVRFVSRELVAWLQARDVAVPPEGPSGALPAGALSLCEVLAAAKGATAAEGRPGSRVSALLSRVMDREEGLDVPVTGPDAGVLHVRAVRQEADGLSWIGGYVAALQPLEQAPAMAANVRAIGGRESVDPLCAFALGELVAEAVAASARGTGRTLRLEPIRGPVHALGHRGELGQALEAFLTDMSGRALPGHQPALSVRETPQGAQLSVLDVGFGLGLPESALERVLVAPTAAPAGLEPLGRLVLAAEDSHGQAEIRTNDGWGITLVITLLRAHPRLRVEAPETGRASTPNVIALGRKQG